MCTIIVSFTRLDITRHTCDNQLCHTTCVRFAKWRTALDLLIWCQNGTQRAPQCLYRGFFGLPQVCIQRFHRFALLDYEGMHLQPRQWLLRFSNDLKSILIRVVSKAFRFIALSTKSNFALALAMLCVATYWRQVSQMPVLSLYQYMVYETPSTSQSGSSRVQTRSVLGGE